MSGDEAARLQLAREALQWIFDCGDTVEGRPAYHAMRAKARAVLAELGPSTAPVVRETGRVGYNAPHESAQLTAFLNVQPDTLTQARRRSILKRVLRINGKPEARAEYIERSVNAGAVIWQAENQRVLKHPDGRYMRESEISKVALDYAAWLIEHKGEP